MTNDRSFDYSIQKINNILEKIKRLMAAEREQIKQNAKNVNTPKRAEENKKYIDEIVNTLFELSLVLDQENKEAFNKALFNKALEDAKKNSNLTLSKQDFDELKFINDGIIALTFRSNVLAGYEDGDRKAARIIVDKDIKDLNTAMTGLESFSQTATSSLNNLGIDYNTGYNKRMSEQGEQVSKALNARINAKIDSLYENKVEKDWFTGAPVLPPEPSEPSVLPPEPSELPVVSSEPPEPPVLPPEPSEPSVLPPEPSELPVVSSEPPEPPVLPSEPSIPPVSSGQDNLEKKDTADEPPVPSDQDNLQENDIILDDRSANEIILYNNTIEKLQKLSGYYEGKFNNLKTKDYKTNNQIHMEINKIIKKIEANPNDLSYILSHDKNNGLKHDLNTVIKLQGGNDYFKQFRMFFKHTTLTRAVKDILKDVKAHEKSDKKHHQKNKM